MLVDGKLNEEIWQSADIATDFWQYFPTDTLLSTAQTEVQMVFDQNIYMWVSRCIPEEIIMWFLP